MYTKSQSKSVIMQEKRPMHELYHHVLQLITDLTYKQYFHVTCGRGGVKKKKKK